MPVPDAQAVLFHANCRTDHVSSEGLRQEAGEKLRVTIVSPGLMQTNFAEGIHHPEIRASLEAARDQIAMPAEAVARAMAYAIEQPADVDVGEIVIQPTP